MVNNINGDSMYILLIILFILFIIFFIPIRVNIDFFSYSDGSLDQNIKIKRITDSNTLVKILYFIPIFKTNKKTKNKNGTIDKNNKDDKILNLLFAFIMELIGYSKVTKAVIKKENLKKLNEKIFFEKFSLAIGTNLDNAIMNAYINTGINSLVSMYIGFNLDRINMKNTTFNIYVSKNVYEIKFSGILRFKLVDTIYELFKIFYRYLKIKIIDKLKNKKIKKQRKENGYGRASNRKPNDDSYDIA